MLKFGLIVCLAVAVSGANLRSKRASDFVLPENVITCQLDSPDRDRCIKEGIMKMLPRLKNGMTELNIPPLEPFQVNNTKVSFRRGEDMFGQLQIRHAIVHGITRAVVKDIKTNFTDNHLETIGEVFFPKIFAEGSYKGEGHFRNFKISSKGFFNISAKEVTAIVKTAGDLYEQDGETYLKLTKFDATPFITDMKVYATGLFPDAELNRIAVEFVNQYWPFMYREMLPEAQKSWEPVLLEELNRFLGHVPFYKLLWTSDTAQTE